MTEIECGLCRDCTALAIVGFPLFECLTCLAISGERPISPGPPIFQGRFWQVDHAYPCSMKGWLVIVLRRHAEALHDLTHEEFMELGPIVEATIRTLSAYFDCEKEYLAQYAEGTGFHHVHIHVVAKPVDLPDELKGPQIFKLLAVDQAAAAPRGEIRELCMELHDRCRLTPA